MTLLSHNIPVLLKYFSIGMTLFQLLSLSVGKKNLLGLQLRMGVGGKRPADLTKEKQSQ